MPEGGGPPEVGDAPTVRVPPPPTPPPPTPSTAPTASTADAGVPTTEPERTPAGPGRGPIVLVFAILVVAIAGLAVLTSRGVPTTGGVPSSGSTATITASGLASDGPTDASSSPTDAAATPTPDGSPAPASTARGYLATRADLEQRRTLAAAGVEPYASAMADLRSWADDAVLIDPRPARRLRIKGTEGPFVDDTARAYGLALAYAMTGDARYGQAAVRDIMAWVDTTTSTRKTCPDSGGCQTSLIISRTVPGFVFAADLLAGSGLMTDVEDGRLRAWLHDVMLPTLSELDNNWGDAGTFARIALTDYLGDRAGFDAAVAKWRSLMDLVADDGHIPAEVARKNGGLGYTQEALDYKVAAAVIAARRGVDLWDYQGARGGSLERAMVYLARYMAAPDTWPWYPRPQRRAPSQVWELAYQHWKDPAFAPLVEERRPQGWLGHSAVRWTTLTNGIPVS